jgi:hypothetical protein
MPGRLRWSPRRDRNATKGFAQRRHVEHRRAMLSGSSEIIKRGIVLSLVEVSQSAQRNLPTGGEDGNVERIRAFGDSELSNEVPERRDAAAVDPAMKMVAPKDIATLSFWPASR